MSEDAAPAGRRLFRISELKAPEATAFLAPALVAWRRVMMGLIVVGVAHTLLGLHLRGLTEFFFYRQDLPVAGLMLLLAVGLYFVRPAWAPAWTLAPTWRTAALIALAVTAFAWAGTYLVYDNYALSTDEFMARFDAQILATGRLAAPVPPQWREYVHALQPQFMLDVPGHAYWVSAYLPVNAAFLALASKLGAESLMPPVWAGISVLATFGVGRRLWPQQPKAALTAALLLATAPQLLITAMTPYAMSAHLALNMVWLWLVLRGGKLGHGAAALVAFLATGLHQLVFHPLFAAPFVLELWLAKRWRPAVWHTAAFATIGLFWVLYPSLLLHALGATPTSTTAAGHGFLLEALALIQAFDPSALGMMAKNLVRFVTWQSLLTVPLAVAAAIPAIRAGGTLRAIVLGIALTATAMLVLLPYQGHGWGYRYLHGLMGSGCLLASWYLTRAARPPAVRSARSAFAFACAVSVFVLLPIRAAMTYAFEHPYAVAERRIKAMDAKVVLVDDAATAFGTDLVRNDPFLRRGPIVLGMGALRPNQWRNLCAQFRLSTFSGDAMAAAGLNSRERHAADTCTRAP